MRLDDFGGPWMTLEFHYRASLGGVQSDFEGVSGIFDKGKFKVEGTFRFFG